MECGHVDQMVERYLDREIPPDQVHLLQDHLDTCRQCRNEYGGLIALLIDPEPVSVPHGLRERIMKRVENQFSQIPPQAAAPPEKQHWRNLLLPMATAAGLALFLMGWWSARLMTPEPTAPPVVTRPPQTVQVVVSPLMVSSMARAATMPGPVGSMAVLVEGVALEAAAQSEMQQPPMIRLYEGLPPLEVQPDWETAGGVEFLPLMPRYLGA